MRIVPVEQSVAQREDDQGKKVIKTFDKDKECLQQLDGHTHGRLGVSKRKTQSKSGGVKNVSSFTKCIKAMARGG